MKDLVTNQGLEGPAYDQGAPLDLEKALALRLLQAAEAKEMRAERWRLVADTVQLMIDKTVLEFRQSLEPEPNKAGEDVLKKLILAYTAILKDDKCSK